MDWNDEPPALELTLLSIRHELRSLRAEVAALPPHESARFSAALSLMERQADGLSAIRAIIQSAPFLLVQNGALWLEHGYDQAAQVRGLLTARGLTGVQSKTDIAGIERIR